MGSIQLPSGASSRTKSLLVSASMSPDFVIDFPQTDLSEWGSDGLLKDPVGANTIRHPVPINFYAQAADLVTLAVVSSTRNGRSRHFGCKNTMVLTHYASQTPLGAKSLFLAKLSICSEGGVSSVSSLFKYI